MRNFAAEYIIHGTMNKGVITGDIVRSTSISAEWRNNIPKVFECVVNDYAATVRASFEMYRGDSFQFVVDDAAYALNMAVAVRMLLRASTPHGEEPWDAREVVGVGTVEYTTDSILTSDGEAFRYSGREFDNLGKRRIAVATPWAEANKELAVSTAFVDDILTNLTVKQAEVIYHKIVFNISQKDLASKLGQTAQNVNKMWISGRGSLIAKYLKRYESIILTNTQAL